MPRPADALNSYSFPARCDSISGAMTCILAVNWEAISAIGQIVGALAVVISLIYLAREIRSNARAARVASMDTLVGWLRELEHPDLSELYYRGVHDFESLKGAELVRFGVLLNQLFHIVDELYYQQLEGDLDPRVWREVEVPMREINAYPGVQAWWRLRSHWFGEEFANYINQLQQTAKPPRMYGEPNADQ
jgi:hypothetical protein